MKFACCSTYQNLKPETGLRILVQHHEIHEIFHFDINDYYREKCTMILITSIPNYMHRGAQKLSVSIS